MPVSKKEIIRKVINVFSNLSLLTVNTKKGAVEINNSAFPTILNLFKSVGNDNRIPDTQKISAGLALIGAYPGSLAQGSEADHYNHINQKILQIQKKGDTYSSGRPEFQNLSYQEFSETIAWMSRLVRSELDLRLITERPSKRQVEEEQQKFVEKKIDINAEKVTDNMLELLRAKYKK